MLIDFVLSCFCVGVSSAYGIINRIDRLMVATKRLVGEHFHIQGLEVTGLKAFDSGNNSNNANDPLSPPERKIE